MHSQSQRRANLLTALAQSDDVGGILVTSPVNVRYLSGFTGSNGALLIRRDEPTLLATDGRYLTQASNEVPDVEVIEGRAVAAVLLTQAVHHGVRRVAVEADHLSVNGAEELHRAAPNVELIPTTGVVESLRVVKDDDEIAALRQACAITDRAFAAVLPELRIGRSERDIAFRLYAAMQHNGAHGLSFDTIVASGPHAAIPHHQPSDRELVAGDLVTMDFGARYDGYHADMTRTVVVGPPADWQRDLYRLVSTIQSERRAAVVAGAVPAEINNSATAAITEAGYVVNHGLGHGVGLQIHESPWLIAGTTDRSLLPGVSLTVEPGIYLPGRGGVRIEDTLLIRSGGNESLTGSPRELVITG